MKKSSTILLQIVVMLIGISTLLFMLWKPQVDSRNAYASVLEIYFKDPFLVCAYIASIPFFIALYQAFILLRHIGQNKVFSQPAVRALRIIKYCAMSLVGFAVAGEVWLFVAVRGKDDIAGGVFMGLLMIFVSGVIATAAAVFERTLQSAVDIKSENDLVV